MERRRLQQQKIKQQQRFCVSQQDLTQAIARMKPQRRATHDNLFNVSSSSSAETLAAPSVSQLIEEFEARTVTTPYSSTHDFVPNGPETNSSHTRSIQTIETKVINNNNNSSSISRLNDDEEQEITKKKQIHQTLLNNDRYKRDLPPSPTSSSYYSIEGNNTTQMSNKRRDSRFNEILAKEAELDDALADLISLSNDADLSSSSRSSTITSHRRRASSYNDNANSISASIALLNNLLETFDLDIEDRKSNNTFNLNNISDKVCSNCHQSFASNEQIVNAAGDIWHIHCFVCAQCFQPFEKGIYFEHEGRKYCERDFQMLYAPCCAECKQAIVGRVIRALQKCFHPDCFRCQICRTPLREIGFVKNNDRALCRECHSNSSPHTCPVCQQMIDNKYVKYKGEYYHPYHYQCTTCRNELDENAREFRGLLYCLPCHTKLDIPVCAACRCLIDGRIINALGKQWHVEHFCCARCSQPFYGNKHYEKKGLAYCEMDYHFLFGSRCFICNRSIINGAYTACNKKYCLEHFACSMCETKLNEKSKYYDVDAQPVCKQCYGKIPQDIRKSLHQYQKKKTLTSILKHSTV